MFCRECGTKNTDNGTFCELCGARLLKPRNHVRGNQQASRPSSGRPKRPGLEPNSGRSKRPELKPNRKPLIIGLLAIFAIGAIALPLLFGGATEENSYSNGQVEESTRSEVEETLVEIEVEPEEESVHAEDIGVVEVEKLDIDMPTLTHTNIMFVRSNLAGHIIENGTHERTVLHFENYVPIKANKTPTHTERISVGANSHFMGFNVETGIFVAYQGLSIDHRAEPRELNPQVLKDSVQRDIQDFLNLFSTGSLTYYTSELVWNGRTAYQTTLVFRPDDAYPHLFFRMLEVSECIHVRHDVRISFSGNRDSGNPHSRDIALQLAEFYPIDPDLWSLVWDN